MQPNRNLPPLSPFRARSFYAMILTLLVTVCTGYGIDLFAWTEAMGLGADQDAIIETGERAVSLIQVIVNVLAAIWAYLERRAPNYRLSFKGA